MTDITDSNGNPVEVPSAPKLTVEERLAALENYIEEVAKLIVHIPALKDELTAIRTRIFG